MIYCEICENESEILTTNHEYLCGECFLNELYSGRIDKREGMNCKYISWGTYYNRRR
jgi:hypothetical protein